MSCIDTTFRVLVMGNPSQLATVTIECLPQDADVDRVVRESLREAFSCIWDAGKPIVMTVDEYEAFTADDSDE